MPVVGNKLMAVFCLKMWMDLLLVCGNSGMGPTVFRNPQAANSPGVPEPGGFGISKRGRSLGLGVELSCCV